MRITGISALEQRGDQHPHRSAYLCGHTVGAEASLKQAATHWKFPTRRDKNIGCWLLVPGCRGCCNLPVATIGPLLGGVDSAELLHVKHGAEDWRSMVLPARARSQSYRPRCRLLLWITLRASFCFGAGLAIFYEGADEEERPAVGVLRRTDASGLTATERWKHFGSTCLGAGARSPDDGSST